jgi:antitoxin ParD1/3/4
MNVSLTEELEEFVQQKVSSGRYHSASEVVREALRLLQDHDTLYEIQLAVLRRDIAVGIEQADRGEVSLLDVEDIKARGRQRLAERKGKT